MHICHQKNNDPMHTCTLSIENHQKDNVISMGTLGDKKKEQKTFAPNQKNTNVVFQSSRNNITLGEVGSPESQLFF